MHDPRHDEDLTPDDIIELDCRPNIRSSAEGEGGPSSTFSSALARADRDIRQWDTMIGRALQRVPMAPDLAATTDATDQDGAAPNDGRPIPSLSAATTRRVRSTRRRHALRMAAALLAALAVGSGLFWGLRPGTAPAPWRDEHQLAITVEKWLADRLHDAWNWEPMAGDKLPTSRFGVAARATCQVVHDKTTAHVFALDDDRHQLLLQLPIAAVGSPVSQAFQADRPTRRYRDWSVWVWREGDSVFAIACHGPDPAQQLESLLARSRFV